MTAPLNHALPPLIEAAKAKLFSVENIFFVPVRHHSPACAYALRALLREIKPAAVLIEGPDNLNHLLPLLSDPKTRTPVAMLCQSTRKIVVEVEAETEPEDGEQAGTELPVINKPQTETRAAFFPFCDYSPEWIAARDGAALGAKVAFIDLPWEDKAWAKLDDDAAEDERQSAAQTLMEERYFAHSRYLNTLAEKLGCVDSHELWDRLFELRPPMALQDWRAFFSDVFSWCAMARLDYEPEVLEAELSLPRERHMAQHICNWRRNVEGAIVVVTGGFHTMELVTQVQAGLVSKPTKKAAAAKPTKPIAPGYSNGWLIRYSFDRLDALNGYASGMPSPSYYQSVWNALEMAENRASSGAAESHLTQVALQCLAGFAQSTRAQDTTDAVSTASVQAATAQVLRLAALRCNAGPSRQDILDAIRSCFIKGAIDDGTHGFTAALRLYLSGTKMGDVPPSAGSPPLIEDARRLALAAGIRLDDSTSKLARLDVYRKPSHRLRSRFFHAMAYLNTGVAQWQSGPDFIGGSRLHLLFEEWRVAWSPMVEARLVELSSDGATVLEVCLAQLLREEAALTTHGAGRSASAAALLLVRACTVGLHNKLPQLMQTISAHLDEDASCESVVDCGHRLLTLWRAREPLGVQQNPQLLKLLERVWPAALFLAPNIAIDAAGAGGSSGGGREAVMLLLSLRELGSLLASLQADGQQIAIDTNQLQAALQRFTQDTRTAPAVAGAAAAILFIDGAWDEVAFNRSTHQRFGAGGVPADSVAFLGGVMAAAPELLLRLPNLLAGMDSIVCGWDDDAFLAHLPDLRQTFTALKPQESAALASQIAKFHGITEDDAAQLLQRHDDTTEADLMQGTHLQQALAACLQRDGLGGWLQ